MDYFELDRRHVPDLAMKTAMVVPIDPLRDRDLDMRHIPPRPVIPDQLSLEQRVQSLRHRVVIRVTTGPDRRDSILHRESLRVAHGTILNSAVAVMDQTGQIVTITPTCPDPHLQRIDRQRRLQPR